ncbi:Organic solvent tolerance-like N-terminal domain-containing protein [Cupriavidus sp. H19C3]
MAQVAAPANANPPVESAAPMPAGAVLCDAPWFRSGSRVQMEGDGDMPMSITMTLRDVMRWSTGCSAQLEVRSKSALSALMGPPVIMEQMHEINIDRRGAHSKTSIDSRNAVINARARYARMFGEAAFRGSGVFNYAGLDIKEGAELEGETFRSSVALKIYPLSSDEVVGTMQALYASIIVSSRHVGRKQMIDTVMGRKECLPITYEKRTSLGPLQVGDDVLQVEPSVLRVTDWYCPAEAFVLRTEIRQNNRVQRIDVTSLEIDPAAAGE